MGLLAPDAQLQAVELAVRATIVIDYLAFSSLDHTAGTHHHGHDIGAHCACVIF